MSIVLLRCHILMSRRPPQSPVLPAPVPAVQHPSPFLPHSPVFHRTQPPPYHPPCTHACMHTTTTPHLVLCCRMPTLPLQWTYQAMVH
jgi:hypothetical protein